MGVDFSGIRLKSLSTYKGRFKRAEKNKGFRRLSITAMNT